VHGIESMRGRRSEGLEGAYEIDGMRGRGAGGVGGWGSGGLGEWGAGGVGGWGVGGWGSGGLGEWGAGGVGGWGSGGLGEWGAGGVGGWGSGGLGEWGAGGVGGWGSGGLGSGGLGSGGLGSGGPYGFDGIKDSVFGGAPEPGAILLGALVLEHISDSGPLQDSRLLRLRFRRRRDRRLVPHVLPLRLRGRGRPHARGRRHAPGRCQSGSPRNAHGGCRCEDWGELSQKREPEGGGGTGSLIGNWELGS